jgi:predicted enzyme related to lactoylglutathione lyase
MQEQRWHPTIHVSQRSWAAAEPKRPTAVGVRTVMSFRSGRDLIIRTEAFVEAVSFYTSVLQLPVSYRSQNLIGFETGSFCLYVERGPDHGAVFEFLVEDVEAAKSRLLAAGCVLVEENPDMPRCYIRDPSGLTFNVRQAAAE